MDEVALFTAIRPDAPAEFGEPGRTEVVGRLLAAAAAERSARPAAPSAPMRRAWPRSGRRLGIGAVAVAALAAAAGILVAVPLFGTGRPGPTHPSAGSPASAAPATPATAAAVLLLAAHAAAATPSLTARPDQFVYTEQLIKGESYLQGTSHGFRTVEVPPYLQRTWQSADGLRGVASSQRTLPDGQWSRPGRAESLCGPPVEGHPGQRVCSPGYLTNLPGTVSGMLAYLLHADGPNGPAAYRVLGSIVNTSAASNLLVPNSSYALMYRAAATVHGIYLVRAVTNIAGKAGIGVAACVPAAINKGSMPGFHGCPDRTELIFDARTYQLIGVDHVAAPGESPLPGRPSSALLSMAVVNKIGQLP